MVCCHVDILENHITIEIDRGKSLAQRTGELALKRSCNGKKRFGSVSADKNNVGSLSSHIPGKGKRRGCLVASGVSVYSNNLMRHGLLPHFLQERYSDFYFREYSSPAELPRYQLQM